MQIVNRIPSILSGDTARVYRFSYHEKYHVLRWHPEGKGAVVSFFAKAVSGSEKLRVTLEAPHSSQTQDFSITDKWNRFEISLRNDISLRPMDVYFTTLIATRPYSNIAIALPQCENGLFATSPIPPDVQLPAISNDPNRVGSTRAADRAWLDKEKTGIVIDSNSATAIIVCEPAPNTDQIMEDQFLTFFSFWSSESGIEISVGISGSHGARFVVRVRGKSGDAFTESTIIGGHQQYFVCTTFDRNNLTVIINGAIAMTLDLEQSVVFDRTYLGGSHGENPDSLNGYIQNYAQYMTPLLYIHILELYRELCPNNPQPTYDYMLRYFKFPLTSESEFETLDSCLNDEGFSYFISQLDFAIPQIFDQFPPVGNFTEENVRDHVMALMRQPGVRATREDYSKIGRTDLSLGYSFPSKSDQATFVEKTYRIEFKIWGRRGYKKAPSQPLKYMSENEIVGAFIMIDRRRSPKISDYEKIVRDNADFECLAIREISIIESDLRYFVSFHRDPRYKAVRMIMNFFLPITE